MTEPLDPVLALALRAGFVLLFSVAVRHKLRAPREFRDAIAGFDLVPVRVLWPVAATLIALELGVVAALVVRPALGGAGAASLLLAYGAAMLLALARGRGGVDCGCGGPAGGTPVQPGLVGRNALLASAALPLLAPVGGRVLGWVDAVTVAGALATATILFATTNALLATAPRIAALRRVEEGA